MIQIVLMTLLLSSACVSSLNPNDPQPNVLDRDSEASPGVRLLTATGPNDYSRQLTTGIATSLVSTEGNERGISSVEILTSTRDEIAEIIEPYTNELIVELGAAYGSVFSNSELEELILFYESDVGRKLVENTPHINFQISEAIHAHTEFLRAELGPDLDRLFSVSDEVTQPNQQGALYGSETEQNQGEEHK